ncbi:MAG: hypothetical protein ACRC6T_09785, partial [Sarcina sp.]
AENALKANTNNLEKAVTVAKTKTGKYTKMSQDTLNEAMKNAEKVLGNQNATPTEVKNATDALNNAISNLHIASVVPSNVPNKNTDKDNKDNDKKALANTIKNANNTLQKSSSVSVDVGVNPVEHDGDLSHQVKSMINNLGNAKNNEHLNNAIAESKASLEKSVDKAVAVLNNPSATSEQVVAVTTKVTKQNRQLSNGINKAQEVNKVNRTTQTSKTNKPTEVQEANKNTKIIKDDGTVDNSKLKQKKDVQSNDFTKNTAIKTGVAVGILAILLGGIVVLFKRKKKKKEDN